MFQGLSNALPFILIIGENKSLFCVFIILVDSKGPSSLGQCRYDIKDLSGDSDCSSINENYADLRPYPLLRKKKCLYCGRKKREHQMSVAIKNLSGIS